VIFGNGNTKNSGETTRREKMDTIKTEINKSTVDDMVASFLIATTNVNDDEDIFDISLGKLNKKNEYPLSYKLKKKETFH
jgi:hypothetical protein